MKTRHQWLMIVGCLILLTEAAKASEQMRSANALESGKWAVSVYGAQSRQEDLELKLSGQSLIRVPLQGGGTAQFFADTDTSLKMVGKGKTVLAKIVWRPFEGLSYAFKFGTGDYEVRIPSRTVTNRLDNDRAGRVWGVEAHWTLLPNTPVSPAVDVSLGTTVAQYDFSRLHSGGSASAVVHQGFRLREFQGAASASKRFKMFEPYGGVRFFQHTSTLYDRDSAERVRGRREGFSPFAGCRWEFRNREALTVEAAGVDEQLFAAGISIGF